MTTEFTRNSRIFFAATHIGSDCDTIGTLKTYKATKFGNATRSEYNSIP